MAEDEDATTEFGQLLAVLQRWYDDDQDDEDITITRSEMTILLEGIKALANAVKAQSNG
jgi:hypothetical protein